MERSFLEDSISCSTCVRFSCPRQKKRVNEKSFAFSCVASSFSVSEAVRRESARNHRQREDKRKPGQWWMT
ncbi:hypothetical protein Pint_27391 [Pistacia integerrima]|uniref:Uncharacterized protein n=1 Tax=Pistacia integerrima TaxID=434235 RepID=A0ACC0YQI3_9ROSI|nr:hypothetical protein Pint_27391 [Pistacia integerrima]